jgi:hypothetical protein
MLAWDFVHELNGQLIGVYFGDGHAKCVCNREVTQTVHHILRHIYRKRDRQGGSEMVLKRCVTTESEVDGGDMEVAIREKKIIRRGKK